MFHLGDFPQCFDAHLGESAVVGAELPRGGYTQVNHPAFFEGPPVVDAYDNLSSGLEIGDAHPGVEWQLFVGGGQIVGAVALAIGGQTPDPTSSIP